MYLTAQKVFQPKTGEMGINAFYHLHGGGSWSSPPLPETNPGRLKRDRITVAPPGNRVRSYVDLVAPDGTSSATLTAAFSKFLARSTTGPLPWVESSGPYLFRVGMDAGLAR